MHLEIDGEEQSGYGEILEAVVDEHAVSLKLSGDTASALGTGDTIQITIESVAAQAGRIVDWLGRLIGPERVTVNSRGTGFGPCGLR